MHPLLSKIPRLTQTLNQFTLWLRVWVIGTNRPTERLNLHASLVSPLLKSYRGAFNDSNWQNAMRDEYTTLINNKTWTLVPRPPDTNIVRCMWLFRHKYLADGTLSRYKASLVANGSTQIEGIDVDETFSSVVKPGTIWTQIIRSLHQEFAMTNLGLLNYNLGISATRDSLGLFLSQKNDGEPVFDLTLCQSLASSLQYLTFTRSDISYAVQQLFSSSTTDLVAYSDVDWAGCPTTRRSTSGYCVFLGNNLHSSSSVRQPTLSRSSVETEYNGVANAISKTFVVGQVQVLHVPSRYQFADIFTKGLPLALFEEFRSSLSVCCSLALTAREC
nr:hypothetical protein [Tanacetum cinerariifolium]